MIRQSVYNRKDLVEISARMTQVWPPALSEHKQKDKRIEAKSDENRENNAKRDKNVNAPPEPRYNLRCRTNKPQYQEQL